MPYDQRLKSFIDQYDTTLGKLSNAEAQIEDLKQQLDASLEAEDMLVQLTNRTMTLSEVCLISFHLHN
jgi:cell shape-determining protein MreC